MNGLRTRLALAFTLVTLVGVLVAGGAAERQLAARFRLFTRHYQMLAGLGAAGDDLLDRLASHYEAHGGWQGVEQVLEAAPATGMGHGRARVMGRGLVLADARGNVVYDAAAGPAGTEPTLTAAETSAALPVVSNGRTVGYLWTGSPGQMGMTALGSAFLVDLRRVLARATLVALVVGVLAGVLMARWLAEPMTRTAAAARGIARGERQARLPESGVAEMAELGRAFNEMTDSLARSEELRAHMTADIAHELRTPLTVIQGNLRAMLDDVYPVDKAEIARVYDESRRLGRLVEDLRDLAHAEAGQLGLRPATIDLTTLLERSVALFAELGRERAVRVTLDADRLPPLVADPDRVGQVVANLLANAVRHAPDGGSIRVTAAATGADVRVAVSDDGPGIAPGDQAHVFDRFWRAEGSRCREAGGSGLGLAIARQIVVAHGGSIGVESRPGAGASFWFRLPVTAVAADGRRDAGPVEGRPGD